MQSFVLNWNPCSRSVRCLVSWRCAGSGPGSAGQGARQTPPCNRVQPSLRVGLNTGGRGRTGDAALLSPGGRGEGGCQVAAAPWLPGPLRPARGEAAPGHQSPEAASRLWEEVRLPAQRRDRRKDPLPPAREPLANWFCAYQIHKHL